MTFLATERYSSLKINGRVLHRWNTARCGIFSCCLAIAIKEDNDLLQVFANDYLTSGYMFS